MPKVKTSRAAAKRFKKTGTGQLKRMKAYKSHILSLIHIFSFNASYYTQEELEKKTHNYELTESDSLVFCVDYALNGIGSNSCGPVVLEQYRFDDVLFRFQFTLIPYVKG